MSQSDVVSSKKSKKAPKREITIILVDVGSTMKESYSDTGDTCLDIAKDILDWIITRKIFSQSSDEFVLMLFGCDDDDSQLISGNIRFCNEEMECAKIDWLKLIRNEMKGSDSTQGDYISALIVAVDRMRTYLSRVDHSSITARNILMISNFTAHSSDQFESDNMNKAEAIVFGIKTLDISLNIIGPSVNVATGRCTTSGTSADSKMKIKTEIMSELDVKPLRYIVEQVNGNLYSYAEALPILQKFVPRQVNIRGQKFFLELSDDLKLPIHLFKKIQEADMRLTLKKFDDLRNAELVKEAVFERVNSSTTSDKVRERDLSSSQRLTKSDVVKAFHFGTSTVPFTEGDQSAYGWRYESRCLKLIQFVKRAEILQHYFMDGGTYYCLPVPDDKDGARAISALVNAMILEELGALFRFVYNAASAPRIMALLPRISKKSTPMFVGINLSFYDDFRGLEFPSLNDDKFEPNTEQLQIINSFVAAMSLAHFKSDGTEGSGVCIEELRPKNIPNPKIQRVCEALKHRALNPNEALKPTNSRILNDILSPKPFLLKLTREPLELIRKKFKIYEIKPKFSDENNEDNEDS